MTTPTPSPDVRELAVSALSSITEEAWGSPPDAAGRAILSRYADAVLAAVSPVIRRLVAEEIAADLAPEEDDRPYFGDMHWNALRDAAAIARTHAHPEEGK